MTPLVRAGRLSAARPWATVPLLFGAGAFAGLGQAPWGWWAATLAGLAVVLALTARARRVRVAAAAAWVAGSGHFALTLAWIVEPFQVDAARDGWMAPFALLFIATGMALFWGAGAALGAWLAPREGASRVAAIALGIAGGEVLRSLILTGFPWALPGHVWIDTPLAQLAAWGGPHGLSLVTLGLAALLARPSLWILPGAGLAGMGWLLLDPGPLPPPDPRAPVVRLVQPNATQALKWEPEMSQVFVRRLFDLTAAGEAPDLVVWPETALPWLLEDLGEVLPQAAEAARAPLVTGVERREDRRYYNSLIVVGPGGEVSATYDKAHLVPFGEYVPFGEVLGRLGVTGFAQSAGGGFSAGPGPEVVEIPGIGRALPLICYEGIFAEEVGALPLKGALRPALMVLVTNDGWFGDWSGPYQHFAQGRLRAIEQGLPMVRVANTGVSGVIDAKGRVLGTLPLNEAGALDLPLPPAGAITPYARTGDWPAVFVLLCGLLAAGAANRRRLPIDEEKLRA